MNTLQEEFKELNHYLDDICKGDNHPQTWIQLTDKFKAFEKRVMGLFTADEVREYIKAAVSIGGRNPGIEKDAQEVADNLLPLPPKNRMQ